MLNGLKARLARLVTMRSHKNPWEEDPLMHPDILAMDLNQVADLPMSAGRCGNGRSKPHDPTGLRDDEPLGVKNGVGQARNRLSSAVFLASTLCLFVTTSGGLAQDFEREVAFAMPADFGQWRPDIFGQNGAYRFRQVDGNCQITFGQNRGANAARAAGQAPRHGVNAYIDRVAAKVGRVERVEVDALQIKSDSEGSTPFVSAEFAYMGNDIVEYHNWISMAWIGNVELLIVAACPASEWLSNRPMIDAFIDKVSITHVSNP